MRKESVAMQQSPETHVVIKECRVIGTPMRQELFLIFPAYSIYIRRMSILINMHIWGPGVQISLCRSQLRLKITSEQFAVEKEKDSPLNLAHS